MVSFHERDPLRVAVDGILKNQTKAHLFHYFPKNLPQSERDLGLSGIPYVDFSLV